MLWLQFVLVEQNSLGLRPRFTKLHKFMAGCTTKKNPLQPTIQTGIDLQIKGFFFFSQLLPSLSQAERHTLIHEAITPPLQDMAAVRGEKVYRATFLCSVSASSFSSLFSARQAALATIRAEWLSHSGEKCTVVEW